MELTDRVALITGGRRIGAFVATELARRGADVAIVYRASRVEAEETATSLRALTRRTFVVQGDLQQPDACRRVVDDTVAEFGRLDVLVNMASIYREKAIDALTPRSCRGARRATAPPWASSSIGTGRTCTASWGASSAGRPTSTIWYHP